MRINKFDYIQIKLASPEKVLSWSYGEVKKAETINYRTHRAELDGLMCEKIFGPTRDYECYCGKYKKYKYKGITCDKCGVEVTKRSVRRERMGHIRLASPVTHVWFAYGIPNKISILLDIPQKKLQFVIYFSRYMVVESDEDGKQIALDQVKELIKGAVSEVENEYKSKIDGEEKSLKDEVEAYKKSSKKVDDFEIENIEHKYRQKIARLKEEALKRKNEVEAERRVLLDLVVRIQVGETITEEEYVLLVENEINFFSLKMGAEAIQYLLQKLNLPEISEKLKLDIKSNNAQKRLKAMQRLKYVNSFIRHEMKPEWMVLEVIPVISPELRPIVAISGGRFATADLNDLYRRVINRNNRLKRLIELGAPDVITRNEKRMLQEAVDALLDNEHKSSPPILNKRKIPLKSLSSTLRGKQGRFRQNLLGKRVDYSGRAVIVTAGRDLSLNQCGVPKNMALELFKPFVIHGLIDRGLAANARSAKYMIESRDKPIEVWNVLDEVIQGHPVFLNRAPTFHKQSIQAFFPTLVEGDAIRIHPLICEGFNADFDGDQMAIHVPLTHEAIEEAKELMLPEKNMLKAASGEFIMSPSRDLIQSSYYLTSFLPGTSDKEATKLFMSPIEAEKAYQNHEIHLKEKIKVYRDGELIETSVGRIVFNSILPESYPFVNEVVERKKLKALSLDLYRKYPIDEVMVFLNKINDLGFMYSTLSGFSIGINDLKTIPDLQERLDEGLKKTREIDDLYKMGLLSKRDKSEQFQNLWGNELLPQIEKLTLDNLEEGNSLREVVKSGSRFTSDILNQIIGFKGIIQDASQRVIELPITSNFLGGLSAFEYFVSSKGARKGLADTALRTADSGYLTRKLCEVSQDCIIREEDCGSDHGVKVSIKDDGSRSLSFEDRLYGRVSLKQVKVKGKVILEKNELISYSKSKEIFAAGIEEVEVRTPLTCRTKFGYCQQCYGVDYGTGELVELGKAVGVMAAQSIGEPASQLVLRTFYKGGQAGQDITLGLPRMQELFEARIPKGQAVIAEIGGDVEIIEEGKNTNIVKVRNEISDVIEYPYTPEDKIIVKPKQKSVKSGDLLIVSSDGIEIRSTRKGTLKIKENVVIVESSAVEEVEYKVDRDEELLVSHGDNIAPGTQITRGSINPRQLLQAKGVTDAQKYIIDEIQRVYQNQGIPLGDKHIEVIVAQMGRYVKVEDPGDSDLIPEEVKDKYVIQALNEDLEKEGKKTIKVLQLLLGITAAALKTESFLSAASFQEQVRVLSEASIMAKRDYLRGLKENVIIGKMIPVGERAIIDR